jgi:hypothetical protein
MSSEQGQRQIEKWRRQERVNQILIRCVLWTISLAAVVGVTILLVKLLRPPPTLTPTAFVEEYESLQGRTVRITGRVKWIQGARLRITDDRTSLLCEFSRTIADVSEGEWITVQGRAGSSSGITKCKVMFAP